MITRITPQDAIPIMREIESFEDLLALYRDAKGTIAMMNLPEEISRQIMNEQIEDALFISAKRIFGYSGQVESIEPNDEMEVSECLSA